MKLLASKVFVNTEFQDLVENEPAALGFYASALKNRISRLETNFKEAKTILGVTGGGLTHEEEI